MDVPDLKAVAATLKLESLSSKECRLVSIWYWSFISDRSEFGCATDPAFALQYPVSRLFWFPPISGHLLPFCIHLFCFSFLISLSVYTPPFLCPFAKLSCTFVKSKSYFSSLGSLLYICVCPVVDIFQFVMFDELFTIVSPVCVCLLFKYKW